MKSNKLKAVIFDWAGTLIDYGSMAPTRAFVRLFEQYSIKITAEEVRKFMGLHKRNHIMAILHLPRVQNLWQQIHSNPPCDRDVDELFHKFVPLQRQELEQTELIVGAKDTIDACRGMGMKIGTCTGYTKAMMEVILNAAKDQGFEPDTVVCADEVPEARPSPFMCYENALRMKVYPFSSMVKVGDTPEDISEGLNAGMWTIGLARSGNLLGLSLCEENKLADNELGARLFNARSILSKSGAHFVVDTIADVPHVIEKINNDMSSLKNRDLSHI